MGGGRFKEGKKEVRRANGTHGNVREEGNGRWSQSAIKNTHKTEGRIESRGGGKCERKLTDDTSAKGRIEKETENIFK